MGKGESFDILVRKMKDVGHEQHYRITIFEKVDSMDDLLLHAEVAPLIINSVVRLERIDNFRFNIFIQRVKTDE